MEKVEKFWHSLFRKKNKSRENKENIIGDDQTDRAQLSKSQQLQLAPQQQLQLAPQQQLTKVTIKQQQELATIHHGSETFPRQKGEERADKSVQESRSPDSNKLRKNQAVSSASLRGRRPADPYDRILWSSSQHFHLPYGSQGRQMNYIPRYRSSSRTGLNRSRGGLSELSLPPPSTSPTSQLSQSVGTLRRQIEPGSGSQNHFHLPSVGQRRKQRLVYGRPGQKTAMTALVEEMRMRSATYRNRSPSMNNEEPIQLAHYPGGTPGEKAIERDDFPAPKFIIDDRKRRHSHQGQAEVEAGVDAEQNEGGRRNSHGDQDEEREEARLRKHEQELRKINSSIGNVFLDTIRQTERIRGAKLANIDPRSAARTPGANKEPRYRLRYISPAWASPSRDTLHARPWDSLEDLERPVVLGSSCCASGCASDHFPPANNSILYNEYSMASLPRLREEKVPRPGYTLERSNNLITSGTKSAEPARAHTLPYIRSVSGRIIDDELEMNPALSEQFPAATSTPTPGEVNSHSGVLYSTNNNFSWLTLAKYQSQDTLRKSTRNTFFRKPDLKHNKTILDR